MEIPAFISEKIPDPDHSQPNDSIPANAATPIYSIDLVSASLNSRILATSDEYFASASNLISPHAPIQRPGVYVPTGAWYDGWETRRHNPQPFDWVIMALGVAQGRPLVVEIDTAFFDGNHAPAIAVQGCCERGEDADQRVSADGFAGWWEVLGRRDCGPSQRHSWAVSFSSSSSALDPAAPITHVRLLMFPDGGIARFRLYGRVIPSFPLRLAGAGAEGQDGEVEVELSAALMGGCCIQCSDQRFGRGANLLLPGRGKDMGDGWETRRSRVVGHVDWAVIKLGVKGLIRRVVVDTRHFRGNFPRAVRVHATNLVEWDGQSLSWVELVGEQKLGPDAEHEFLVHDEGGKTEYTHVKMTIIPDGGVKRLRVFGAPT